MLQNNVLDHTIQQHYTRPDLGDTILSALAATGHDSSPIATPVTRRRLLRSAVGGAAGLAAWYQGWPHLRSAAAQQKAPSGQMTWAIHTTVVPSWFDRAEMQALVTTYMILYAIHDALLKPMPDDPMFPCLATKWSESADGLTYDFELRQGRIQQKAYDEARFMPIWEPAFLCAAGPRVAVSELNVKSIAYSAPYEDVQLST